MPERRRQLLRDDRGVGERCIGEVGAEACITQAVDPGNDAFVFDSAGSGKRRQIVMEDRVERGGGVALVRKALHPDPIGNEDMVEGRQQRAEEGAAAFPQFGIGQFCRSGIDQAVRPAVIVGEHAKVIEHRVSPLKGRRS
ncbi:hypothetical protein D9M68_419980 [compost metagenome]